MRTPNSKRIEAVKFLIQKGADVDVKAADGKTPLKSTATEIDDQAIGFLERFFKLEVDADKVNVAKPKIAEILRKNGADD